MTRDLFAALLFEITAAAIVWTSFVVHYWVTTRGRWRKHAHGRNVMALAACLAVMVDLTLLSVVFRGTWLVWASVILWPALAFVGIHRHCLLWRDQREKAAK